MKKKTLLIIIISVVASIMLVLSVAVLALALSVSKYVKIQKSKEVTAEEFIMVADYVFSKYDGGEYIIDDYEYDEFLASIEDDDVYKIVLAHPDQFGYMTISSNDQVTFEDDKVHLISDYGTAVIRNNITPLYRGEQGVKPREAFYKEVNERVYKYSTSGH